MTRLSTRTLSDTMENKISERCVEGNTPNLTTTMRSKPTVHVQCPHFIYFLPYAGIQTEYMT